jgi:hypothetical protein
MLEALKHRRFRFSLLTLFVVVTVLCCWLGWQVSIVHERKALLAMLRADHANISMAGEVRIPSTIDPIVEGDENQLPTVRRWLGDEPVTQIMVGGPLSDELERRSKVAFPEANLMVFGRDGGRAGGFF